MPLLFDSIGETLLKKQVTYNGAFNKCSLQVSESKKKEIRDSQNSFVFIDTG